MLPNFQGMQCGMSEVQADPQDVWIHWASHPSGDLNDLNALCWRWLEECAGDESDESDELPEAVKRTQLAAQGFAHW